MNGVGSFEGLPESQPFHGLRRRTFDGDGATVNEYRFEPGAQFPLHAHAEEQITLVTDGEIELSVGEETVQLAAGGWAVTAGGVPHGIRAREQGARILAIVVPRRPGPDAYEILG
jgi:quercetin dioxygenase-like cupin family protein